LSKDQRRHPPSKMPEKERKNCHVVWGKQRKLKPGGETRSRKCWEIKPTKRSLKERREPHRYLDSERGGLQGIDWLDGRKKEGVEVKRVGRFL